MSRFSDKIKGYLLKYIAPFDLVLLEEADAGFKARYDFVIPCKTKVLIEVDGNYNKNATCYSNIACNPSLMLGVINAFMPFNGVEKQKQVKG